MRLVAGARHAARNALTAGDFEDLPTDVLRDIGALQGLCDALHPRAFQLGVLDPNRTNDDLGNYVAVARALEYVLSDASFTSKFSAAPASRFWRDLARDHVGVLDFVATLDERERVVVFGFLVRLQRFLASDEDAALHALVPAAERVSRPPVLIRASRGRRESAKMNRNGARAAENGRSQVVEADRASLLYYLLAAPEDEHAACVELLKDVVSTCRTYALSAVDRALVVRRPSGFVRATVPSRGRAPAANVNGRPGFATAPTNNHGNRSFAERRASQVPRAIHGDRAPQRVIDAAKKRWRAARRGRSVDDLLHEGGLDTAARFLAIEDRCLEQSLAIVEGAEKKGVVLAAAPGELKL